MDGSRRLAVRIWRTRRCCRRSGRSLSGEVVRIGGCSDRGSRRRSRYPSADRFLVLVRAIEASPMSAGTCVGLILRGCLIGELRFDELRFIEPRLLWQAWPRISWA